MSAIPKSALTPNKSNNFQQAAVENTDDALLTDQEVYQLKGGDSIFALKLGLGLTAVLGFLRVSGRISQVRSWNISGSTFLISNVILLGTMALTQSAYLRYINNWGRYKLHQTALFSRYIENSNEVHLNRKKPKIH